MKWYFAMSEASLARPEHDWPGLMMAAVNSAARNTSLRPHLLYDGQSNALTDDLARRGVTIIPHRVSLYEALAAYAARTRQQAMWLPMAAAAFLRFDIPILEQEDARVLYTDVDVLFLTEPRFFAAERPSLFAASTQQTDQYDDMNSGVMLINVPAMRTDHAALCAFAEANLQLGLDQEVLRVFYRGRYDLLDRSLNWKPYWGHNPLAQIVHFHGPKPTLVRTALQNPGLQTNPDWLLLLGQSPGGYRTYLDLWDSYAEPDRVLCTVDLVREGYVAGWAVRRRQWDRRVELRVRVDGEDDGSLLCDQPRPDVADAGFGSARSGFRYCPPPALTRSMPHIVEFTERDGLPVELLVEGRPAKRCVIPAWEEGTL